MEKETQRVFRKGKWICPQRLAGVKPTDVYEKQLRGERVDCPEELRNLHFRVRKRFRLESAVGRASVRITADDYYKLTVNGHFVGQGPAQGYPSCYYWNEFELTGLLREGENTICADVYYQGLISRAYQSGDGRIGMIAEVYGDGRCLVATDAGWESAFDKGYRPTHINGANTMFSEDYDSRAGLDAWTPCAEKRTDHVFSPEPAVPLQVYEKAPVSAQPLPGGGYLYDFGEEITGTLRLTARGRAGDRIRILCGEELEESEVRVRYRLRCNCLYEEYWTMAEGGGTFEQYDYRGFRYAAIIPESGAVVESVMAVVRHYPFDDHFCELETESEVLRQVWAICKNGVKYGSQEVFVDCPTREKGQYAGDLTVTSASHLVLTGDPRLLKKAIDNQAQSAAVRESLLAVTPGSFLQEIADYSLQFPILALRYYRYTGDRAFLRENLKVCEGILRHFGQYAREDGLLCRVTDTWNLVDWPENQRDGYDFPPEEGAEPHNVINAFYIGCMRQTERIRELLGVEQARESPRLIAAFQREFLCPETGLYVDRRQSRHSSLHANVLPVYYGFYARESEEAIGRFLAGKGLCCGVYMAYFLLKALCRLGRYEEAYRLIVSQGEHSWYNMVKEGATTCFEAWGKEQKANTSLCHPWGSAPVSILAEDILPYMPAVGRLRVGKGRKEKTYMA